MSGKTNLWAYAGIYIIIKPTYDYNHRSVFMLYTIRIIYKHVIELFENLNVANGYFLYNCVGDSVFGVPKDPEKRVGADIIRSL